MRELNSEELEKVWVVDNRFSKEERERLKTGLLVWLNDVNSPQSMLVNNENLSELIDLYKPLRYYVKYFEDKELIEDIKTCYSLLLNIQKQCPPSMKELVREAIDVLQDIMAEAKVEPFEGYEYFKRYPKSKQQRYEEAVEKTKQELMKEQEAMSQYDKWDIVMAGLLKSKIGSEETFRKKYIEEAPSLDETLIDVCKSISQELSNEAKNFKRQKELIQKLANTEKDLKEEEKRIKQFREKVLDAWIEQEAKRLRGEA
jgi:hypothetical protein